MHVIIENSTWSTSVYGDDGWRCVYVCWDDLAGKMSC